MEYFVRGKNKINLTQKDFVSKGGEGSIYRKGNIIYKIYTDSTKMISEAKIQELSLISSPNVIKPKDIILNKKNTSVGFTMDEAIGASLCKLFTKSFRDRNNIRNDCIIELVENIKKTINLIHKAKCLIVDGNEFNYIINDKDFTTPFFIDVNSYQTPSFPATAIMLSIKDFHSNKFSALTDWFSFAIIACQLFVGIHPFKGKHPNYKKNDLEKRMIDNVSIFNSKVRVPSVTRDFSSIPNYYLDWFVNLFEKGIRSLPPALPGTTKIVPVKITVYQTTDSFEINLLQEFEEDILYHNIHYGIPVVKTENKIYIGRTDYKVTSNTEVLMSPKYITPILVKIENNKVFFKSLDNKEISSFNLECEDKMVINNTLYLRNKGKLIEIEFHETQKIIPIVKTVWDIMPNSSEMFSGIIYQSILGKSCLTIPNPELNKLSSCANVLVPELDSYKIIDAKHDSRVVMLIGFKDNSYDRIVLRFSKDYIKYDVRIEKDINYSGINFVTLDNGVVISNDDDIIEIFFKEIGQDKIKKIQDTNINSTMKLCKDKTKVMFFKNNKIYNIKVKSQN